MSDKKLRSNLNELEAFEFDELAWTVPPALSQAKVAIVTTAGLKTEGNADWNPGDQGYTVLAGDRRDFHLAHFSPNFDRTGFVADINVVYPVDRLHELADAGVIGSVAEQHYSFMGAQVDHNLETMRLDTGPAVAQMMRNEGVDVAILTPV